MPSVKVFERSGHAQFRLSLYLFLWVYTFAKLLKLIFNILKCLPWRPIRKSSTGLNMLFLYLKFKTRVFVYHPFLKVTVISTGVTKGKISKIHPNIQQYICRPNPRPSSTTWSTWKPFVIEACNLECMMLSTARFYSIISMVSLCDLIYP